jgi:hypothetical protein
MQWSDWSSDVCSSDLIAETRKRFGHWICFRPQIRGETPTPLGPLERANLNH